MQRAKRLCSRVVALRRSPVSHPRKSLVFALAACVALAELATDPARAANDPTIEWHSLETPHFRVSYYTGEEESARRVADLCESIFVTLVPAVGWPPSERVEVSIVDQTDSANAFATSLPYDSIRLYATAPDDLSPLGDVDDWYLELITHEFTHVLHTDHIRGIPAIVNKIIGKTLAPNQVEPRFILEGLAVFEESSKTSGGRLRSSIWNMYMRTDVLQDNVAPLDVFSSSVRRWPQGNLWYLYGSFFIQWIAQTYGEQAIRNFIDDYSYQIIPYAINRSMRRATGRTFEELYPAWIETLRRDYGAQALAVRARGLREGTRITFGGQSASFPRFIPKGAWDGTAGDVIYARDDAHDTAGLYRVPLRRDAKGAIIVPKDSDRELLVRTAGNSAAAFLPDGSVVFDSLDIHRNLFAYEDLFFLQSGAKSAWGLDGSRKRLTDGLRATHPDVSPDGRRVVFTTNKLGTTYLQVADLDRENGKLDGMRVLVPSKKYEQAYSPRWSPDNRHVAYSAWQKGGYRDVRVVDTIDGTVRELMHDRALDGGPSFSPDGKYVYFHSDRVNGVMNVFEYELATSTLKQVTNVLTGAFEPVVSADGKTLVYLGYGKDGYDLYAMDLDRSKLLDVAPFVEDRPTPPSEPIHHDYEVKAYNPLHTLAPRRYQFNTAPGSFGQSFSVAVAGNDIAGRHAFGLSASVQTENASPQVDLEYTYGRLPFDMSLHAYRAIAPGSYGFGGKRATYVSEAFGVEASLGYEIRGAFDSQSFGVGYSVNRVGAQFPSDAPPLDPFDTPQYPSLPLASILRFSWGYSNAQRFLWSISAEKGFSVSAGLDFTHPAIASDYRGFRSRVDVTGYLPMPWLRHHVLALHAGGGVAGGSFPGGPFYVGGFIDVALLDQLRSAIQSSNFLVQGGVALRGYPSAVETGRYYALMNAEYRFPIVNIDRGLSTLPLMLNRISGNVFVDFGSAFDNPETAKFKTGVGGEFWLDFTVGYFVSLMMRVGYARGLASEGLDKFYFVASVPY